MHTHQFASSQTVRSNPNDHITWSTPIRDSNNVTISSSVSLRPLNLLATSRTTRVQRRLRPCNCLCILHLIIQSESALQLGHNMNATRNLHFHNNLPAEVNYIRLWCGAKLIIYHISLPIYGLKNNIIINDVHTHVLWHHPYHKLFRYQN